MTKLKDSRKVNYLFGIGDFMRIGIGEIYISIEEDLQLKLHERELIDVEHGSGRHKGLLRKVRSSKTKLRPSAICVPVSFEVKVHAVFE